jgi:hypothetical protein
MEVILGSRVISPEQQDEEGVFLLMQLEVIPWTVGEKRRRSQRERDGGFLGAGLCVGFNLRILTGVSSVGAA